MGNITTQTLEGATESLKKVSTSASHMLGARYVTNDGRAFRYAKAGASIAIGRVVGHIAKAAGLQSDCLDAGTMARTTAQWDAGTHTVNVATTSSATTSLHIYANRYDDGYVWVNDEAGEGQLLQIKSHGISTSSGTTAVALTIYDDCLLTIALTTDTQVGLIENLYKDVVTHTGTTGGGPALGVAPLAVTSGQYFWLQTFGPCPVMAGPDTLVAGEPAVCGITTGTSTGLAFVAGSIYPTNTTMSTTGTTGDAAATSFRQPELGYIITVASGDAEYALVFLTVAP